MSSQKVPRHLTLPEIKLLCTVPGELTIRINKMDGYFVPFVFFAAPRREPVGQGPILQDGQLLASVDLDPLVSELKTMLGHIKIFAPSQPSPDRVLH